MKVFGLYALVFISWLEEVCSVAKLSCPEVKVRNNKCKSGEDMFYFSDERKKDFDQSNKS